MHLVLPTESTGRKLDLLRFKHPRTGQSARFLIDPAGDAPHGVYELTKIGSDARSVLVDDRVSTDGSLVVATPIHPLFLLLNVLFGQRRAPLPLDTLLELAAGEDTESVPDTILEPYLNLVCSTNSPGLYQLDETKLRQFLDTRVARVRAGLPPAVRAEVVAAVQPVNPGEQPSADVLDAAETYAAVSMVATSWLGPELADWLLSSHDFSVLEAAAARVRDQQAALLSVQFAQKRTESDAPTPAPQPKRTKVQAPPRNNTSILDMFKKK